MGSGGAITGDSSDEGDGPEVVYQRRRGLRRLRMSFDCANRLVVRVPWNCRLAEAGDFVARNRDWIERERASLAPVRSLADHLAAEPFLTLAGDRVPVEIRRVSAGRSLWIFDERRREGLLRIAPDAEPGAEVLRLVRRVASRELERRVRLLATRHGFEPRKTTVRDQVSRWGSCSRAGTISLNWRLLLCSPGVQDYVVLHELAHLAHLDHSRRFHALLDRLDPGRRAHEEELARVGPALMRVGRR